MLSIVFILLRAPPSINHAQKENKRECENAHRTTEEIPMTKKILLLPTDLLPYTFATNF